MNDRDSAYQGQDPFQRMAALSESYGIDQDQASKVVANVVDWLSEVLAKSKDAKLETRKAVLCAHCGETTTIELLDMEKVSKTTSNLAKTADTVVRLNAFTQGKEDSRPGGSGGKGTDWLQALTNEQMHQVMEWVTQNQAASL